MATTATVVNAWSDAGNAHLAIRVREAGGKNVEYIGSTPLLDAEGKPKDAATLETDLTAAAKAVRDSQVPSRHAVSIKATVEV